VRLPELASAYRYHPFSVDEPHIGTDDVFLEGAGPWRVIYFRRTEVLESDGQHPRRRARQRDLR
jgi:hypothetical protein